MPCQYYNGCWSVDLTNIIKEIISQGCPTPAKPEFVFELTKEAALKNYIMILKRKYKLDFQKALKAHSDTPLGYGSEFRHPSRLEPLFLKHPNWNHLKSILLNGSDLKLEDIDKESRKKDLAEALKFGNHKGATDKPDLLKELIAKDVTYGYAIALPLEKIEQLDEVCMAPMNIAPQHTIDKFVNIVDKDRLTHDQSFKWEAGSGTSVNSRIVYKSLKPVVFGHCIRRIVNWTIAARRKYPNCRIYCSKIAFR